MASTSPSPSPTPSTTPPDSQPRPTVPRRRPSSQYSRRSVVSSFRSPPSLSPSTSLASPALTLHHSSSPALHRQASGSSTSDASTSTAEMKRTLENDAARLQLVLDRKEQDKKASKGRGDVVVGVPTEFGGQGGGEAGMFLKRRKVTTPPGGPSLALSEAASPADAKEGAARPPLDEQDEVSPDPPTVALPSPPDRKSEPDPTSWFGTWTRTVISVDPSKIEQEAGSSAIAHEQAPSTAAPTEPNPRAAALRPPPTAATAASQPPASPPAVDQQPANGEVVSRPQSVAQQALAWIPRPVISTVAALPGVRSYAATTVSSPSDDLTLVEPSSVSTPDALPSATVTSSPALAVTAAVHEGHLPAAPGQSLWFWSTPTVAAPPQAVAETSAAAPEANSSTSLPPAPTIDPVSTEKATTAESDVARASWFSLLPGSRLTPSEVLPSATAVAPCVSTGPPQEQPAVSITSTAPESTSDPPSIDPASTSVGSSWWGYVPFVGGTPLTIAPAPADSELPPAGVAEEPSFTPPETAPASTDESARATSYLRPLAWLYGSSAPTDAVDALPAPLAADADEATPTVPASDTSGTRTVPMVAPVAPSAKRPTSSSSSPAPSPRSYGSWLANLAGPVSQQRPSASAAKAIGLGADVGEVMDIDDDMTSDKQAAPLRQSPPSSVRTQKSSFFSAISKSPSASSLVGQVSTKVVPLASPAIGKAKAGSSRSGVAAIAPAPPNLVLPTFDDIFNRPPRSVPPPLPRRSGLAKKALGALGLVADKHQRPLTPAQERVQLGKERGRLLPKTLAVGTGRTRRTVRRVVIIGVHGWFPQGITRRIAGEPTGTSIAFASRMCAALDRYIQDFGLDPPESVTVMPLEGDGTVASRVEKLFQDLVGRADVHELREADAILIGTHSQGCPVSTHLLARLLTEGYIRSTETTIAMLGLCGVHQGPLTYINKSAVLGPVIQYFDGNAAATELFEFQDTESKTAREYIAALATILDHNVKVVLVASLNDQVVPVYSSTFAAAHHPNILRLLHIDGWAYDQADSIFVTHLIRFCLQLRNAGVDDGGLIAHLSESVAHGLTGVGHSTAYAEDASYAFVVRILFESGDTAAPEGSLVVDEFLASEHKNSYDVPWILRGIMEDQLVLELFGAELSELRASFDQWTPYSQKMKDLRRKLEPLRPKQSRRAAAISPLAVNGSGLLPSSATMTATEEPRRSRL